MTLSLQAQGALWKFCSVFFLVPINGVVHHLARSSPTPLPAVELAFLMDLVALLCLVPVAFQIHNLRLSQQSCYAFIARGAFSATGLMLWFLALELMPLAQVTALKYTTPFITLMGAWLFLGESMTRTKIIATCVALIGASLIAQADLLDGISSFKEVTMHALIPIGSVFAFVGSELLGKSLTNTEPTDKVTFYLFFFTVPFLAVNSFFVWIDPTWIQCQWIILMGVLTVIANFCLNRAFGLVEISFLVPLSFSRFILSVLMGIVIFSEWPSAWVWCGSAFILSSTVYLMYSSFRHKPRYT